MKKKLKISLRTLVAWNSNVLRFGLKKTLCQTTVEATVADCSTRPVQRTRNWERRRYKEDLVGRCRKGYKNWPDPSKCTSLRN